MLTISLTLKLEISTCITFNRDNVGIRRNVLLGGFRIRFSGCKCSDPVRLHPFHYWWCSHQFKVGFEQKKIHHHILP